MNAHGAIRNVAPTMIKNIRGRSEYQVMQYYKQKVNQLTYIEQHQLLNSLEERSRYILFQVMSFQP